MPDNPFLALTQRDVDAFRPRPTYRPHTDADTLRTWGNVVRQGGNVLRALLPPTPNEYLWGMAGYNQPPPGVETAQFDDGRMWQRGPGGEWQPMEQSPLAFLSSFTAPLTPGTGPDDAFASGAKVGRRVAGVADDAPDGIRAYHGSPHHFDRFDMSRIGTGEGAQAYGHGLYFAGNEATARTYRDALSGREMTIAGQRFEPRNYDITQIVGGARGNTQSIRSELNDYVARWQGNQFAHTDDAKRIIDAIDNGTFMPGGPGNMYEVRLNVRPDQLLDWDKPLSQQPAAVAAIAREAGAPAALKSGEPLTGGGLWRFLDNQSASAGQTADEAMARLRAAGIPGIQYLDAGSRAANEGTRNYVMFDDALVEIMRKYGLLPLAAGAGAAAASYGGGAQANPLADLANR